MRRARSRSLVPALMVPALMALSGCDSPPPSPGEPARSAAATSEVPKGLAPMPTGGLADQPLPQLGATASATVSATATATEDAPPEVVAAQHLLVAFKGASRAPKTITRSKADAKKRAEEAAAKARKGDDFTALVKEYSDEPGAAERMGNLGKFKRGAMAKPFEDAAFGLKVGEVSGIVETEFGFHVIKRNQ